MSPPLETVRDLGRVAVLLGIARSDEPLELNSVRQTANEALGSCRDSRNHIWCRLPGEAFGRCVIRIRIRILQDLDRLLQKSRPTAVEDFAE